MVFTGSLVALVTPFDRKGRLNQKTLEKLVEWHIAEGTDGIVCSATTGEGPCLVDSERKRIAESCIRTAAGRIPIIVATGVSDTRMSVRYTEQALKLGANGCLVVTPYYNKPTQRGCVLHFKEVAKVGLPIIVYHNPTRAGIRVTSETVFELSQIPNVVGFKDSGHDIELVRKIHKWIPVLSGDDDFTYEIMREGGVGVISPTANIFPRGWKRLIQLCLQGKWDQARSVFQRYLPFFKAVFLETNPQGIKYAMSWLNQCLPDLRLPLTFPTEGVQHAIKKEVIRLALPQFTPSSIVSSL